MDLDWLLYFSFLMIDLGFDLLLSKQLVNDLQLKFSWQAE